MFGSPGPFAPKFSHFGNFKALKLAKRGERINTRITYRFAIL